MFAALLDTSVLWPSLPRDFLLSLAIDGMYRPQWSSAILAELEYTETQKLMGRGEQPDVAATRARHLIDQMTAAFDDALVENWEPLQSTFGLPDPDDEHVVAVLDPHWTDCCVVTPIIPVQKAFYTCRHTRVAVNQSVDRDLGSPELRALVPLTRTLPSLIATVFLDICLRCNVFACL